MRRLGLAGYGKLFAMPPVKAQYDGAVVRNRSRKNVPNVIVQCGPLGWIIGFGGGADVDGLRRAYGVGARHLIPAMAHRRGRADLSVCGGGPQPAQ
ncbi:hypothetical protein D3C77_525150 [compost metagenome]